MSKKTNPLEEAGKQNAFKVPAGYFENLSGEILSKLPERIEEEPRTISLWERSKPWLYLAAMFMGIALMVNIFVSTPHKQISPEAIASQSLQLTSSADIDDFYLYYEDQMTNSEYRKAIYLNNEEILSEANVPDAE